MEHQIYRILPADSEAAFSAFLRANINHYPWDTDGYQPKTYTQIGYRTDGFLIGYEVFEKELRAMEHGISPNVYKDSAVELFLMPAPHVDGRYFNFEFNALGAMYIGVGTCRGDNVFLSEEDLRQFDVRTKIHCTEKGCRWSLRANIPFAFLRKYTAFEKISSGFKMRANFYKICDGGEKRHYGCWNPIISPVPDYHRPECFGSLLCC